MSCESLVIVWDLIYVFLLRGGEVIRYLVSIVFMFYDDVLFWFDFKLWMIVSDVICFIRIIWNIVIFCFFFCFYYGVVLFFMLVEL